MCLSAIPSNKIYVGRSSRAVVFCKKAVLKNFAKLCQIIFFLWILQIFYRTPPYRIFCNLFYRTAPVAASLYTIKSRSSPWRCSVRKGVLRNLAKFTGKHLCESLYLNKVVGQSLYFNKVAGLRPPTLLKKRFWHRYFPVNFAKFLRKLFLQNTSGRLLNVTAKSSNISSLEYLPVLLNLKRYLFN